MWTRKGGLLLFLGVFSIYIGFIIVNFQTIILGLMILVFFLLALVIPRPMVTSERTISNPQMFEHNELDVKLKINRIQQGFGTVEIYDRIPEYSELKAGINNMIYNPRTKTSLDYRLRFPVRGYYSVGPLRARIADHFNIFVNQQELLDKERLSVFPRIAGLKAFNFKSKKNIHFPGEFLTSQAGSSTEFYNIRNYQKGDPFKKINWKVYARKRELMVNDYEKENICDTILFLDARTISNIGTVTMNALETNIKLALAITNFLILHRNQVGMVMYNDRVKVLPPKAGMRQRNDILRFLTGVYAKSWTGFNVALDYAKPYIKTKTTLIIFSNLDYDLTLFSSIQEQIAFNNRVIIISPSTVEFELKTVEYSGPMEKVDLFRMSRQNFIDELRDLGALVIHYTPDDEPEEIIEKVSIAILR